MKADWVKGQIARQGFMIPAFFMGALQGAFRHLILLSYEKA
jgi:hypothetical protein